MAVLQRENNSENDKYMVFEMIGVISLYAVLAIILEVVLAKNKIYSVMGIVLGSIVAVYMLIYMDQILKRSIGFDAKTVEKYVIRHSIIRYLSVVIVFGVVCFTNCVDPLACFIGLLGLKVAAYLQPIVHKIRIKKL